MDAAEKKVGQRFDEERQRLGLGVQETADACGVTRHAIGNVFRGAMPSGTLLQKFALAGADIHYVLTGARIGKIDLNLLGVSEAALRLVYEKRFPDAPRAGAFRPRILALVYNQVIASQKVGDNINASAVLAANLLIDSFDDPAAPDLLIRNLFAVPPAQEATAAVNVRGDGNRVAGRDMIGGKGKR